MDVKSSLDLMRNNQIVDCCVCFVCQDVKHKWSTKLIASMFDILIARSSSVINIDVGGKVHPLSSMLMIGGKGSGDIAVIQKNTNDNLPFQR